LRAVKALALTIAVCAALLVAGCGDNDSSTDSTAATTTEASGSPEEASGSTEGTKPKVTVPSGAPPKQLETTDLRQGSGAEAKAGDEVTVQYVGVGYDSEEEFDASWDRGEPFTFQLGAGQVIQGWDEGVEGMKVGGQRELVIPPGMAYGPQGSPPVIGPNETLIFVVDLVSVE
jgi:peptidylprolyl isomerase